MVTVKYVYICSHSSLEPRRLTYMFSSSLFLILMVNDYCFFCRVMVATAFIVLGNSFLVAFGNHQSPGRCHAFDLFIFQVPVAFPSI